MMSPTYSVGTSDRATRTYGSSISSTVVGGGSAAGLSTASDVAVGRQHLVLHVRRGGDQVDVVLAPQALLHDLHVEQAEEAAAEAEAERDRGLGLVEKRGVVERELAERLPQVLVLVGVDRVEPGEHHRLGLAVAGQRLGRGRRARR